MPTLLEAKEITKIYGKSQYPSIDKVSFGIVEREFISIMGASDYRKTMSLKVLSTIVPHEWRDLNQRRKSKAAR